MSIFEQNGTAVGFKQYTNNRNIMEAYSAPETSTNNIDRKTLYFCTPGLEMIELLSMLMPGPYSFTDETGDTKTVYGYALLSKVYPIVYNGVLITGLYNISLGTMDMSEIIPKYQTNVYDAITGRILVIPKGDTAFFESFLEYREQVRKGEIVDEH